MRVLFALKVLLLAHISIAMVGEPVGQDMTDIARSTVHIRNSYKVVKRTDAGWSYVDPADISKFPDREYAFLRCEQNDQNCVRSSCTGFNSQSPEGNYTVDTALHCLGTPVMKPGGGFAASYDVGLYAWVDGKWKLHLNSEHAHPVNVKYRTAIEFFEMHNEAGHFIGTFPYSTKIVGVVPGSMATHPTSGASNYFYFDNKMKRETGAFADLFDFGSIQMADYATLRDKQVPDDFKAERMKNSGFNIPDYCPEDSKKDDDVIAVGTGSPDAGVLTHLDAEVVDTFGNGGWILAKPKNPEHFVCGGDSGGPIFSKDPRNPGKHCVRGNIVAIFTSGSSSADCTKEAGASGYFLFVDPRKIKNATSEELMALKDNKDEWSRLTGYFPSTNVDEFLGPEKVVAK